jgi:NO-binding membrane sensor protein with MHYT domain/C4-dicarboxylate-specific signal transduction histidine kinase
MYRVYFCVTAQHDLRLVLVAGLICYLACYTAFKLIARVAEAAPKIKKWWIGAAAVAIGSGIWATHFIAMLAFQPAMPIVYDDDVTVLSFFVAIIASGLGIAIAMQPGGAMRLFGGAVIGAGIGAMHYIGTYAMAIQGTIDYDARYVLASLGIGIVAGAVAAATGVAKFDTRHRLAASTVLTLAICGMHFTGMTSIGFHFDPTAPVPDEMDASTFAMPVAAATFLILLLGLAGAVLDERLAFHAALASAPEAAALKHEIEQRKAAQAELQCHRDNLEREVAARTADLFASEARLADAIEALPEAFVLFDAEDRLVVCNALYRALSETIRLHARPGITFEELIRLAVQRGDHVLEGADPEAWVQERLRQHRAVGREPTCIEQQRADGRWLEVHERRLQDGGIVILQVDVTEIRSRLAMLAERDKLTALGQLAGGVAHEINNLLQPALVFPEMVRENLPPEDLESREFLDSITESVKKARDIVRNILLFARKEEAKVQTADLVAEIGGALKFIQDLLPPGITLLRTMDVAEQMAIFNKTELTQVLSNLVLNAAHASGGQGTIEVELGRSRPSPDQATELGLLAGAPYATITVSDQGSGMDAATLARIFEPFFTTKPVGVGTGLGLSVVMGILRSWNGAIDVASTLGLGTTFTLYIPIAEQSPDSETAPSDRAQLLKAAAG